ncbi:response regulator transcription factor [Actinomadura sp. HBU206391]|uniref:response regulator transcription factor n=1 Tax=Actinomadura sp. HBU206391 TaxID=2731692 RepID=UPI0016502FF7|nr:response regulator transcription factor [Actinomadura sp. HBU206391]MBC6458290.1 response regulator transcription factor [Actinomadura sp. HBU206391]
MRLVIAEDSVLLRSGLVRLLEDEDLQVVAEVGDGDSLLEAVATERPDVAIIDVRMPPTFTDEGIHVALTIRKRHPEVSVLVLSQWVEETSAGELLRGGMDGIGYLLKDRVTDINAFIAAVRQVAAGGSVLDPDVVTQILAHQYEQGVLDRLSTREGEVLACMAEGLNNAAISRRLFITERAVEKHIRSIFTKLQLSPEEQDQHRRVAAVLRYLSAIGGHPLDADRHTPIANRRTGLDRNRPHG